MPRPKKKTLWDRVRELREKKGLSQDALAKLANLPTVSVSKVELWKSANPTIRTLAGIAHALDVNIDELVKGLFNDKD